VDVGVVLVVVVLVVVVVVSPMDVSAKWVAYMCLCFCYNPIIGVFP
jgi:hypothetical protein